MIILCGYLALTLLASVSTVDLPEKYADLAKIGLEAAYRKGNALLKDGKPYEALPWLRKAEGLHDTAALLQKGCYLLPGTWVDGNGAVYATFREDGTCTLDGKELCFNVIGYDVWLGPDQNQLTKQMIIRSISARSLTLTPNGEKAITLTRLDPASETPGTDPSDDNFAVEEE